MAEIRTSRPFQERFLDGFERSRLRGEQEKVRPRLGGFERSTPPGPWERHLRWEGSDYDPDIQRRSQSGAGTP